MYSLLEKNLGYKNVMSVSFNRVIAYQIKKKLTPTIKLWGFCLFFVLKTIFCTKSLKISKFYRKLFISNLHQFTLLKNIKTAVNQ